MSYKIEVNDKCIGCKLCLKYCPGEVFEIKEKKSIVTSIETCINCGHCIAICPTDAIFHSSHPLEICEKINEDFIPNQENLFHFLRVRRSGRHYKDTPISEDILNKLADVSRFAPTATNAEDVEMLIITNKNIIKELGIEVVNYYKKLGNMVKNPFSRMFLSIILGKKVIKDLSKYGKYLDKMAEAVKKGAEPIFKNPPALFLYLVNSNSKLGRDNACYAAYNMVLMAETLHLTTCINGFVTIAAEKDKKIFKILNIPKNKKLHVAVAVGYPENKFKRLVNRKSPKVKFIKD